MTVWLGMEEWIMETSIGDFIGTTITITLTPKP